jgi:hypothetical protein
MLLAVYREAVKALAPRVVTLAGIFTCVMEKLREVEGKMKAIMLLVVPPANTVKAETDCAVARLSKSTFSAAAGVGVGVAPPAVGERLGERDGDTVGVGVRDFEGDIEGVADLEGVALGEELPALPPLGERDRDRVGDALPVLLLVTDGVPEGVPPPVGVREGVPEGVPEADLLRVGETDGVPEGVPPPEGVREGDTVGEADAEEKPEADTETERVREFVTVPVVERLAEMLVVGVKALLDAREGTGDVDCAMEPPKEAAEEGEEERTRVADLHWEVERVLVIVELVDLLRVPLTLVVGVKALLAAREGAGDVDCAMEPTNEAAGEDERTRVADLHWEVERVLVIVELADLLRVTLTVPDLLRKAEEV